MKNIACSIFYCLIFFVATAQNISIIPQPKMMQAGKGSFVLSPKTVIVIGNAQDENSALFFNDYLLKHYGFSLKTVKKATTNFIKFNTLTFFQKPENEEAYSLKIISASATIKGNSAQGSFYGMQSLIQLLPVNPPQKNKLILPQVTIQDEPRFGYRGLHLDCSRHFFSIDYIKKYIDYIALHKLNTFHWHLTDDQGWRLEIKKYPKLTQVGSKRNGTIIGRYPGTGFDSTMYGGFYTQEQAREIVEYAAQRFITVVPEIDFPGHSMAALTAYPELGTEPEKGYTVSTTWGINNKFNNVLAPNNFAFQFLEDVLNEVMDIFPSTYIHIGGDECSKRWWNASVACLQFMKENNLKDGHELQSYIIKKVEGFINKKGRKMMGWDEILEGGLAPNATVMSWQGEKGGIEAAKQLHDVVMTPGGWCYFDHTQTKKEDSVTIGGYTTTQKVYNYEPIPKELKETEQKYILGAQANVWTEYMAYPSKIEYMIFPRLAALSEVLWSGKEQKNWEAFKKKLNTQILRYKLWRVNYFKGDWEN